MVVRIRSECYCCCCFAAFPNQARENVHERSFNFLLAWPSKCLGQGRRISSSLFYLVSVVNCKAPYSPAFSSTTPSPFGLDLEFPGGPHSPQNLKVWLCLLFLPHPVRVVSTDHAPSSPFSTSSLTPAHPFGCLLPFLAISQPGLIIPDLRIS